MVLNLWLLVCECICVWADLPGDRQRNSILVPKKYMFWFYQNYMFSDGLS